jgi:hypothetical protein
MDPVYKYLSGPNLGGELIRGAEAGLALDDRDLHPQFQTLNPDLGDLHRKIQ